MSKVRQFKGVGAELGLEATHHGCICKRRVLDRCWSDSQMHLNESNYNNSASLCALRTAFVPEL